MSDKIKLSPRSKQWLTENELLQLREYLNDEPVAYTNIRLNTGIARATIDRVSEKGFGELAMVSKLKNFLFKLNQLQ